MTIETLNKGNDLSAKIRSFKGQIHVLVDRKEKPRQYSCQDADAEEDLKKIEEKVLAFHLDLLNTALRKAEREFKAL